MALRKLRALVGLGAVALLFVASHAGAAPCEKTARPVRVPLAPADLGVLPEACEATEASLETHAAALVATSDLYGSLQAGVGLRGRLVVAERTWLSLWAPSLEYRFVANASVEADRASLGGGAVGAHHRLPLTERLSLAPFVRVLLPTETAYERASRWGGEHGISAQHHLTERLELYGGYAFSLTTVWNGGRGLSLLTESIAAGVVLRPWRVFGVAAGAALRFALGDERPFESFDPQLGVRFYPYRGWFVALNAALPLAGRDRTDLGLALAVGWQQ